MTALDRGNSDFSLIGYKFNMRAKLREQTGNYEQADIYSVATLLDPRYILYYNILTYFYSFSYKDAFFMDVTRAEEAKSALHSYIEAEIQPEEPVLIEKVTINEEVLQDKTGSIIGQINKRIRLERHMV